MAPRRGKINPADVICGHLRQFKAAVTDALQSARVGTIKPVCRLRSDHHMAIKFGRPIEMRDAPRQQTALAAPSLDLVVRPRRNRKAEWARRLVRENVLTSDDLIWPLFVVDGHNKRAAVASMPGVDRLSIDEAVRDAERAVKLNIPCIALFPYTEPSLRDEHGSEAVNPDNLVCRSVRAIKKEFPGLGVLCDVALDPFTSHGHDGLIEDGKILNDETVAVLVRQALVQAEAGCDIIAPSDMMDGRVGAIRKGLDAAGFLDVQIMAYAAKYASAFYGPFRDAVGSAKTLTGDKRTYQMDSANSGAARGRTRHRRRCGHGDGEAGHALSRHPAAGQRYLCDADLRLPGVRRIRDDRGSQRQWLDRRRAGDDGKPARIQARGRRWHPHLFCSASGGKA